MRQAHLEALAVETRGCRILNLVLQQDRALDLIATSQVDRRLVEDVVDQDIAGLLGHILAGLHRLSSFHFLGGVLASLRVECCLRGVVICDRLLEFLGLGAGDEAEDHRFGITCGTGVAQDGALFDLPAVPNPDRDCRAGCCWWGAREMKLELAGLLACPVKQLRLLENLAAMRLQELGSFAAQLAGIGKELVSSQLERLTPLSPFSSLHPVLIFDPHDRTGRDQLVEELRDLLSQFHAALAQVGNQEVGQRLGIGPDACVRRPFMRQLTDQEDQRTNLVSKVAVLFLGLLGDLLGDFLKQDTGVQHSCLDMLV